MLVKILGVYKVTVTVNSKRNTKYVGVVTVTTCDASRWAVAGAHYRWWPQVPGRDGEPVPRTHHPQEPHL